MGVMRTVGAKLRRSGDRLQPPTAMADGVTHGPNGTWAWVVIPPEATDELNTSTLVARTLDGAGDLRRLIPAGSDFHIKVQWGRWSGQDYLEQELRPGMNTGAVAYVELGAERIDKNKFPRRLVLLGVRMDVQDTTAQITARAKKIAGAVTAAQSMEDSLARTMRGIKSFQDRMAASSFGARPATTQELAWSLRRDLRRTVDWVPTSSVADAGQVARLTSTQVVPYSDHIEISTDVATSYVRLLVPTETGFPAGDLELPGGEWLKGLDIVGSDDDDEPAMPVEVSIRGRNIPKIEAAKRLKDALSLAKEQERTAREGVAEEAPEMVADARASLALRLREVQNGSVGMIEDTPLWIVEADDLETLERRTNALIDFYGSMNVSIWAPPNLQDLLWKETVVGDKRRVTEFAQFRPSSTLVGSWFHGGSQVGSNTGPFLAKNTGSTPGPFRTRLTDSQLGGGKVTSVFLGESGSAKSTSLELHVLGEVITIPVWVGLVDIKGDLKGIADVCERYGVPVTRVSTSGQAPGSLCPFRYNYDPAEAASVAVDNLSMMLPSAEAGGTTERTLRKFTNEVARRANPAERSTAAVIELLQQAAEPAVRDLGDSLAELAQDPLAMPVAGKPDMNAAQLPVGHGLVYFCLDNMRWPGSETARAEWKPGHRLTAMVVQAVFTYMLYMSTRVKGIPKVLALTELHFITRYDFGRDLVGATARTGRALDTNLLLDTQACQELLSIKGLADQVSAVYAFRVNTVEEADAQARFLGLQPENSVRQRQMGWKKGECLTRDADGQIGPIRFDRLSPEIAAALQTTPERNAIVDAASIPIEENDALAGAVDEDDDWDTPMEFAS